MQIDNILKYNINDNIGEFTYKVRLTNNVMYDESTGYLYCNNVIVGNVGEQLYGGNELGINQRVVKVHRRAEHIFDDKSLDSLKGKPVTLNHPNEMVNSKNAKKYVKGAVYGEPRHDGTNIICDMVIYDEELINLVTVIDDSGERVLNPNFRDLSLGYNAKLVEDGNGEYHQEDIEYNHLAVVREGRASNAMIVDEDKLEKGLGKKLMGLFSLKKGQKVKVNDDNTIEVLDEETEKELTDEEKQALKDAEEKALKEKELKDAEEQAIKDAEEEKLKKEKEEKENEEKEKMEVKDKAYFQKAFADAKALPNGQFKEDVIAELNEEYSKLFPKKVKEANVLDNVTVIDNANGTPKETLSLTEMAQYIEDDNSRYYEKLTDPTSHESNEAWLENYNKEVRLGKVKLNR